MRSSNSLQDTIEYIKSQINGFIPSVGIILGTGLGGLISEKNLDDIIIQYTLDYSNIPHFPVSTVESHHGNLLFGKVSNHDCIIMQGRFHYYEGYNLNQITYPIQVMKSLGVHTLMVSNACGAVNPMFKAGDLMIMRDHINFLFDTPLKGIKQITYNKKIYDPYLIELAEKVAIENNIKVQKGVYCSLRGPCLETRSEYRIVRKLGADVVGMSTIPEALASGSNGIRVFGMSVVTDLGFPDTLKPASLEEIIKTATAAEPNLVHLTKKFIEKL